MNKQRYFKEILAMMHYVTRLIKNEGFFSDFRKYRCIKLISQFLALINQIKINPVKLLYINYFVHPLYALIFAKDF